MGTDLSGRRCGNWLSCATLVPLDRCWLAASCGVGCCASPLGQPHLAIHAELCVRLHDFRQHDCGVVLRGCAILREAATDCDARRMTGALLVLANVKPL